SSRHTRQRTTLFREARGHWLGKLQTRDDTGPDKIQDIDPRGVRPRSRGTTRGPEFTPVRHVSPEIARVHERSFTEAQEVSARTVEARRRFRHNGWHRTKALKRQACLRHQNTVVERLPTSTAKEN